MSASPAVSSYLSWVQTPEAGRRAEQVSALALAYLYGELDAAELRAAETAMTAALDDSSPVVRRALAEALAGAEEAPRHIVVALANDQSEIAATVLARSPALRDADLVDCIAVADGYAQAAAAIRPEVSEPVCEALAQVGGREACVAVALNPGSRPTAAAMARMIERFGDDAELREALLGRCDLPHGLRHGLAVATASALSAFVTGRGWLSAERAERLTRESRDKSAVIVAAGASGATLDLARHLRRAGHLTPGLLLRSLLSSDRDFFAAALADLADVTVARAQGLMRDPHSTGFAALCERAGLPGALAPAFRAAIEATRKTRETPAGRLSLPVVSAVVDACEAAGGEAMGKAMALLRRFETEAAVEAAREEAARAAEAAAFEELRAAELAAIALDDAAVIEAAAVEACPTAGGEVAEGPDAIAPEIAADAVARETPVHVAPKIALDARMLQEATDESPPAPVDLDAGDLYLRGTYADAVLLDAPDVTIDPATVAQHDAQTRIERRGLFSMLPSLRRRAA
jgi:uncharacterized protein (DUF2336 family)